MIISQLIGGLGNQMFQYAAGRALSILSGVPLRLDTSGFTSYGLHQGFELEQVFFCPVTLATTHDVRAVLGWQSSSLARRLFARPALRLLRNRHFIVEPHFHYWPGISRVPLPVYLMGYWQSERYFSNVAEIIRKDFTFKQPMTGRNSELAAEIGAVNSVSIHVRRGDYVNNPMANRTHGLCSIDYYKSAIKYIADRVCAPHFFVFSDDINWVKANLNAVYPCRYIDHNRNREGYNDMRLMSLCKHHIISNSTFSWWGAWLNAQDDKIVIAPKRWFAIHYNTKDLLPESWVVI